jgi:hypothetical protein
MCPTYLLEKNLKKKKGRRRKEEVAASSIAFLWTHKGK